jgi:hypothetical protein
MTGRGANSGDKGLSYTKKSAFRMTVACHC